MSVQNCSFDGSADGESAFKEGRNIEAAHYFFNLRYPFWHDHGIFIQDSEMTELCRAALWYSDHVEIRDTKLHGIQALRECSNVAVRNCDIISPEFGWSTRGIHMEDTTAASEYFMMRSEDLAWGKHNRQGQCNQRGISGMVLGWPDTGPLQDDRNASPVLLQKPEID